MQDRYSDEIIPGTNLNQKQASTFEDELASLLNRHSMENESNTPDFILAEYMTNCLIHFQYAVQRREQWYGRGAGQCAAPVTETSSE